MIQTAQVIKKRQDNGEGTQAEVRRLFDPARPSTLSHVFNVTPAGYVIHAGALEPGTTLRVEMVVGGTFSALRINGVAQELTVDNNVLQITTVGRYRLRVVGAQNAGSAVVEGSPLGDWA